jgi:membrane protein implicated in regulation of membrane protease activity
MVSVLAGALLQREFPPVDLLRNVFLVCFLAGGTVMVCQFLLSLFGLGGHHDLGGDAHDVGGPDLHDMGGHDATGHDATGHDAQGHDTSHEHTSLSDWLASVLTFRTVVAALTFFGLAGLAGLQTELGRPVVLAVALAAGTGAMFLVAWVMRSLSRLHAEGTARIERAVGKTGTVYLTVPGNKAGAGKVHLNLQNRTVECQAVTAHQALPNGTRVVVTAVIGRDTVEVAPAPEPERVTHV